MKTIRLFVLFFVVAVSNAVYSQDTIPHINSECKNTSLRSIEAADYGVSIIGDSTIIQWERISTCATIMSAVLLQKHDTLTIQILEKRNYIAKCGCNYDMKIALKTSDSYSKIQIDNDLIDLSAIYIGLKPQVVRDNSVYAFYDSENDCILFSQKTRSQIKSFEMYDESGAIQTSVSNEETLFDMDPFKPGLYILRINLKDNSQRSMKFIKN